MLRYLNTVLSPELRASRQVGPTRIQRYAGTSDVVAGHQEAFLLHCPTSPRPPELCPARPCSVSVPARAPCPCPQLREQHLDRSGVAFAVGDVVRHRKFRFTVRGGGGGRRRKCARPCSQASYDTHHVSLMILFLSPPPPHPPTPLSAYPQGVVAGWDRECRRPTAWVEENNIGDLPHGRHQPFYTVLPVRRRSS